MKKLSQSEPPLASNPANGINNIPLNGNEVEGVTKDELRQLLKKLQSNSLNYTELSNEVVIIADRVQDSNLRQDLYKLSKALLMSNDGRTRTKDPITKKLDPSYTDIANKIESTYLQEAKNVYNNSKVAQVKKKKKTRGNPFRVLMGKVGKLLDHGVEKNDIVRYISKLKYWNKETIERAIDIVRDYNKKLEQDKPAKEKEAGVSENSIKTAAIDYDKKPDFLKRSTPELIMRACFLMDLQDYSKTTKQGDFKDAADKKGVSEELKQIKAALKDRGFDNEELSNLGLGK
jgi:hypothetical protein